MHRKHRIRRAVTIVVIFVIAIVAVGTFHLLTSKPRPVIAMFDDGVPGTKAAQQALVFAHSARIDEVISYSVLNASPADITNYLHDASVLHVKIAVSLKDLLGCTDLDADSADQAFHHQFDSKTVVADKCDGQASSPSQENTDSQVASIVRWFESNPYGHVISRYFISDELPETATDASKWMPALTHRYQQLKRITHKPLLVSLDNSDNASFYAQLKTAADDLAFDYYPYPANPENTYGTIAETKDHVAQVRSAAGRHTWFSLQGFSYYDGQEPENLANFSFSKQPPADSNAGAPRAAAMEQLARLAFQGGACNVAIFSYSRAALIPGQLHEIEMAVKSIRNMRGHKSC